MTAGKTRKNAPSDASELSRREQEAAADHSRALRAQDPGAIKQWLVLAPITFEAGRIAVVLDEEQIPQEASLRPGADQRVTVERQERVWTAVESQNDLLDFNRLLGEPVSLGVAYAVCYIHSEAELAELVIKVGSDDRAKIYLNGKEIYRCGEDRTYMVDQDVVRRVELKSGVNVLVFKVVNTGLDWQEASGSRKEEENEQQRDGPIQSKA